jgi:hypothetical protein
MKWHGRKNFIPLVLCVSFCVAQRTLARPVAFLGAYSLMQHSREDAVEFMYTYSQFQNAAFGIHVQNLKHLYVASGLVSVLPLRWNEEGRQSNIYISLGVGAGKEPSASDKPFVVFPSGHVQLDANTETRSRYFAMHWYSLGIFSNKSFEEIANLQIRKNGYHYGKFRAGFAPYLAPFGGLHSFIILEADYAVNQKKTSLTPIVRLFHQNLLLEFGVSVQGKAKLTCEVEL